MGLLRFYSNRQPPRLSCRNSGVRAVPLERMAESLFEAEPGRVAEIPDSSRSIGLRVAHVPFPRRTVVCTQRDAGDLLQRCPDFVQRVSVAVAGVVHIA